MIDFKLNFIVLKILNQTLHFKIDTYDISINLLVSNLETYKVVYQFKLQIKPENSRVQKFGVWLETNETIRFNLQEF